MLKDWFEMKYHQCLGFFAGFHQVLTRLRYQAMYSRFKIICSQFIINNI
ncbi:hypothetical protein C427_0876 [Paraglaciecola psychrophila 170]|uniref:Uncharacterized protein n=1 Tax=Paraglaciecola psychrophila 170 TaxID=1129794 RepID=K7A9P2_9ALTE|nr:hypothetical protein C427_0876 [Paraglaciecola psychrophila 170]GAC39017.1 hypothetical protein GPSY_3406 [Paraglaciecola psychrophila 170]